MQVVCLRSSYKYFLAIIILLGLIIGTVASEAPTLLTPTNQDATIKLIIPNHQPHSISPQIKWSSIFKVYLDSNHCCEQTLPIQGTYHLYKGRIEFQPDFPFSEGISYRVQVDLKTIQSFGNASWKESFRFKPENTFLEKTFFIPKTQRLSETEVTQIYPSGNLLPENLLRFYIYFSNPMQLGVSSQYIKLIDDQGKEVQDVFMQYKQELWSPNQQRLTLLFEPGRIKRGVGQNLKLDPALLEGRQYKLVISGNWKDVEGKKLKQNFEKHFKVIKALRTAPAPQQWKIHPPSVGSLDQLAIELLRPFDHALLKRFIQIRDPSGKIVKGTIKLAQAEMLWLFRPSSPWKKGAYSIQIDTTLEDVVGNNLQEPLDRDLTISSQKAILDDYTQLMFDIH